MNTHSPLMELKGLCALVADSRKGYQDVGNKTKDHSIARVLLQLCEEREGLRVALEELISPFDTEPDLLPEDLLEAGLPRTWIDIRAGMAQAGDTRILEECERCESYLLAAFNELIEADRQSREVQLFLILHRKALQDSIHALERSNSAVVWNSMQKDD